MAKPVVALVGRPNVGKSTLFNRIVGRRIAIVEDLPGTTRDRLYSEANWNGREFLLIDTGGFELNEHSRPVRPGDLGHQAGAESGLFLDEIKLQAQLAMDEADIILFVVDGLVGVTGGDDLVAKMLYRTDKPVILVVNKADNKTAQENIYEFYALGLGEPYPVSAIHGTGSGDLLDVVVESFPALDLLDNEEDERLKIAIVGRPNVGKSSLLNRFLGYERVIVSDVPGTTRDAIDSVITFEGEEIVLIDTAGMRRRGRIEPGVEQYSVLRAFKAIKRTDVCLLVIDATDMVADQDAHIGGYIVEDYKGVIIVVNKWDLVEKDTHTIEGFTERIRTELRFLSFAPVVFVSALTGQRIQNILRLAQEVQEYRTRRIPTGELNRFLQEAVTKNPPKGSHRQPLKFYYATQASVAPPTFVFFVNNAKMVHFTYERYLENQLRATYQFVGTPIRLVFRNRAEE